MPIKASIVKLANGKQATVYQTVVPPVRVGIDGTKCPHGVWLRTPCYCDSAYHSRGHTANTCESGCVVA